MRLLEGTAVWVEDHGDGGVVVEDLDQGYVVQMEWGEEFVSDLDLEPIIG